MYTVIRAKGTAGREVEIGVELAEAGHVWLAIGLREKTKGNIAQLFTPRRDNTKGNIILHLRSY